MGKNVKQYENILEKIIIKFGIDIENKENALEVISCLKDKKISISTINVYPNIVNIKSNKVSNILSILKLFQNIKIEKKYFETIGGDILAYGDSAEIKKIIVALEKNDLLKQVVKKCPKVFYLNTASVIEDIITLYKNPKEKLRIRYIEKISRNFGRNN